MPVRLFTSGIVQVFGPRGDDVSPHSDQVAVTICVHALRRNLCKLDETFWSDTDLLLEKKRNLAVVCWLGARLRSRRVFGLASRYPLPVVDVGFE
jgi:hypothetical protein